MKKNGNGNEEKIYKGKNEKRKKKKKVWVEARIQNCFAFSNHAFYLIYLSFLAGIPMWMSFHGSTFYSTVSGAFPSPLPCLYYNDSISLDTNNQWILVHKSIMEALTWKKIHLHHQTSSHYCCISIHSWIPGMDIKCTIYYPAIAMIKY